MIYHSPYGRANVEFLFASTAVMAERSLSKKVTLSLIGLDGNAFNLLGQFRRAARQQGWSSPEIESVLTDAMSGDYDHLLQVLLRHTQLPDD